MDTSVYEHLAEEQGKRYLAYREVHGTYLSERECEQAFFSQRVEVDITNIINQGLFASRVWKDFSFSRRKQ